MNIDEPPFNLVAGKMQNHTINVTIINRNIPIYNGIKSVGRIPGEVRLEFMNAAKRTGLTKNLIIASHRLKLLFTLSAQEVEDFFKYAE